MTKIFRDKWIAVFTGLSLVFNGLVWFYLWWKTRGILIPITLRYNIYFGADLTGAPQEVFVIPFVGLSLLSINLLLGYFFYESNQKTVAYFLAGFLPVFQAFLLLASMGLVLINKF